MSNPKILILTDSYGFEASSLNSFINEYFSNCDVSIINNNDSSDKVHFDITRAIPRSDMVVFYCDPGYRLSRWQAFYLGVMSAFGKPRFVKCDSPINEYRNYMSFIKHGIEVEQKYLVNKDIFKFMLETIDDINGLDIFSKSTVKISQFLTKNGIRYRDEYDINERMHDYSCTLKTKSTKNLYARNEFNRTLNIAEYEMGYNNFTVDKIDSRYKNVIKKLRNNISIPTYDGDYIISFDEIQLGSNTLYLIEVEGDKNTFTDLFRLLNHRTNISESVLKEKFGDPHGLIRDVTNLKLISNKFLSTINLRSSTEVNAIRTQLNDLCKDSFVKNIKERK